jgi:hypothetical protein
MLSLDGPPQGGPSFVAFEKKESIMTRTSTLLLLLLAASACEFHRPDGLEVPTAEEAHVAAADALTERYAKSSLSRWNIRARAAGARCDVLFVETSVIMEDSMIETIHYGSGHFDAVPGGVQNFTLERKFRGVTYKDPSARIWTYGSVKAAEAEQLAPCRRGR